MTEDVVAELERWLELWDIGYYAVTPSLETIPLVKRARDEIVRLRSTLAAALPEERPAWFDEWWMMTGMHGPGDCYRALRATLLRGAS